MKIQLGMPFSRDFKAGYLLTNKEPRRVVSLVGFDGSRTSMSYARYLYSCKIGEYVSGSLEVDHIDDDKMNDNVDNLQVLSKNENISKSRRVGVFLNFTCPICGQSFILTKQRAYKKISPTCSRKCGGKKSSVKNLFS